MAPRLISDRMLELFPMQERTKGRHVSDAITKVMRNLHPERFGTDPIDVVRANLGNALERAIINGLAEAYPDRFHRPGELEYRGITGTPDLWDVLNWKTVEIKLTWASAKRAEDIEDAWFWRYWKQVQAYCKMSGMTKGGLIIIFINGGWEGGKPGMPVGLEWEDDFTEEQLDETWEMIEAYA